MLEPAMMTLTPESAISLNICVSELGDWLVEFRWRGTFSRCFSSPRVKLSISSAFLMSTVPLVSVCAMSRAEVKTATLAFVAFLTIPARNPHGLDNHTYPKKLLKQNSPSDSRPNTIPCTTLLPDRLPPMIFTTRTLSTLKFLGLEGMTANAASATKLARVSSYPYCFDAMAGFSAVAKDAWVNGFGRLDVESSENYFVCQQS